MIKQTLLKCLAIFLVWFTTVFAFGLAIIVLIKLLQFLF
jgi:hypothetical protein